MSDFYQEYGLETEPSPVFSYKPEKKKGGWLGRIIALLLGFVIGIGACIGAVCAILFSPVTTPLSLMGLSQADQEKLISREYLDDSILSVINALSVASQTGTIAAYDEISPAIGDTIRDFADKLNNEMGIDLNKDDALMKSTIADLPITMSNSVKSTPVGNIFRASNGNQELAPMLMQICYGVAGEDYYIEDGEVIMIGNAEATTLSTLSSDPNSVIDRVTIEAVTKPDPSDTVMLAIAYGQEGITFKVQTDKKGNYIYDEHGILQVEMLQKFIEKNKQGEFTDHNGKLIHCKATPADNGYTKIEQYQVNSDNELVLDKKGKPIVQEVYFVKYDENDDRYYAYESAKKKAEPIKFQKTLIGDMTEDSSKVIDNLLLKDVIELDFSSGEEPNGVLVSLAYGEEGIDFEYTYDKNGKITGVEPINDPRTIGQLRSRGDELINDIPLHEVLKENRDDAITMYLLYGKEGIHYYIDPETDKVEMNYKFIAMVDGEVYNEYGEKLTKKVGTEGKDGYQKGYVLDTKNKTYTDRKGNVYTYAPATDLAPLTTEDDKTATPYYLYDEEGEQVKFPKTSLGDLAYTDNPIAKLTKHMTVVEVLGEENIMGNKFLKHVADYTVDELPTAIDNLTMKQVFETDMYTDQRYEPTGNQPKSYIDNNGVEVHEGDFIDENGDFLPEEKRTMKGIWKYMLMDGGKDVDGNPTYTDYKVTTEMNPMLDQMTENIQNSTLKALDDDKIMEFDDNMLQTNIKTTQQGQPILAKDGTSLAEKYQGKTVLGELTVLEMLDYTSTILAVIEE